MSKLKSLGLNIKKYKKMKNPSQNALAEMLDFSQEHLACVEIGKEYISLEKMFELADILEIPIHDFFTFD